MSSIFGTAGTSQNRSSLFGTQPAVTQAGASSSIFGTTQPTTNLFGTASQSQQQQQQQHQQQQPGGSLFGSLGATSQPQQTQAQQTSGSLFGSLGSSLQPQQQQQQSQTLFGAPSSRQTNLSQSSLQPQQSGAYFDSLLEKSRKRAHGETALEDLPNLQLGLGDLRQRIKRLGPIAQDKSADGRAHYLLAGSGVDAGSAIRDLNYIEAQAMRTERGPGPMPSDTDVESYLANLQSQTTLSMIADGLARSVRDFDTFLEENVALEWDTQRKRIYQHFGIKTKDVSKPRNSNTFGASGSQEQGGFGRSRRSKAQGQNGSRPVATPGKSTFGRLSLQKSVIGTPGPIGKARQLPFADVETPMEGVGVNGGVDDRFNREQQDRFSEKVQALNAARLQRNSFPVFQEFAAVEAQSGEQHVEHVVNAYGAMVEMTGESSNPEDHQVKERQFADAYLTEEKNLPKAFEIRKMILSGANRHFEKRFFQDLEALVAKNPREANLGGVPDVVSKVKAYIRIRAVRKDLVDEPYSGVLQIVEDDYLWAIIFYLLRSGYVTEAAKYVKNNPAAFRAIDRNFATYITSYSKSPERKLPRELQDRINNEYSQRVRIAPEHSIDPFRMACYKILGRCDIEKRNFEGLKQSMEDWVWLQFNLAREAGRLDEVANEVYGLAEVQNTIQEIGARHFSKGGADQAGGVGVYFYLQVLAGLFEEAVKYLYTFHYVDGLHFAIALAYYGLLRVSDHSAPTVDLLTHSTRGLSQINFVQMIGHYTRDFRAARVVAAVDYVTLICLNADLPGLAGQQQAAECHEALRELALETREFAQLLGDLRADGQRIKGAIEERMSLIGLADSDEFIRVVTIQAASVAEDNGRSTDAVLLYHLAGEFDNVISIMNRAESEYIAADIGQDPTPYVDFGIGQHSTPETPAGLSLTSVDHPHVLAKHILDMYGSHQMYNSKIDPRNRWACAILIRMGNVKALVREQKWTQALDVIEQSGVLPMDAHGDSASVRQSASLYPSLPQTVARNVPQLIIWTIQCCSQQRSILASGQFSANEGTRRMMIDDLKVKAKDLMMYAGFLRYRLPPSVNDTLARIASE